MQKKLLTLLVSVGAAWTLHAAPKLRLTATTLGPILVAQGANGTINAAQVPYAYNIGDGSLNLKVSSSDSWLVPALGKPVGCGNSPSCTPVQITLQTATLAKGTYTGFVTVSDPNAIDSPQTISVTVSIGGNVPDQLTIYAPPNGSVTTTFNTGTGAGAKPTTQSGGSWLSVAGSGFGSFQFTTTYTVTANAAQLAAGDYNGSIAISGSSFSLDNKTVPVLLHVTTQPIAQSATPSVQFQIAQGAAKQTTAVSIVDAQGPQGTLKVSGATAATSSGGNWLTATPSGNAISLIADPLTLAPGTYQGTVTVASNAVNGPTVIPVQLNILASGPPLVNTGVANGFTYSPSDGLSQGDFVALFGTQFSTGDPQTGTLPLGTGLGGTQVLINGQAVPVQYVSATQINIQIPYNAATGIGTLSVVRGSQQGNTVSVQIAGAAPALLPFPLTNYILAQTASGGFEGYKLTPGSLASYIFPPAPPAQRGDTVVFYAVGLGPTSPAVTAGTAAPSSPLAMVTPTPMVCFGGLHPVNPTGTCSAPQFAGLTPGFFGLYQINFTIPQNAPSGDAVQLFVQVGDSISNILNIAIQ